MTISWKKKKVFSTVMTRFSSFGWSMSLIWNFHTCFPIFLFPYICDKNGKQELLEVEPLPSSRSISFDLVNQFLWRAGKEKKKKVLGAFFFPK